MATQQTNIRALFTRIATSYDRLNRVLSLGTDLLWRRKALKMISIRPTDALDLACGTGDMTIDLVHRFPNANITAADLTPAMTEIASEKFARLVPSARITLKTADATNLKEFENASFSLITCAFGFRNFPDRPAALRECARILKDGGELLVLEFFRTECRPVGIFTSLWLKLVTSLAVRNNTTDYTYLRKSIERNVTIREFTEFAVQVGLSPIRRRTFFPSCSALLFKRSSNQREEP